MVRSWKNPGDILIRFAEELIRRQMIKKGETKASLEYLTQLLSTSRERQAVAEFGIEAKSIT